MRKRSLFTCILFLMVTLGLSVASGPPEEDYPSREQKKTEKKSEEPKCKGLKKSITVYKFDTKAPGSRSEAGDTLTDMLQTALVNTGCFIVVERAELEQIMKEQKLAETGKTAPSSAAKAGSLVGAQVIVMGAVTTFEENERGGAIGGVTRSGRAGGIITNKAKVTLDMRLVDTSTGEVLQTATASGDASQTGALIGGIPVGDIKIGTAAWQKTPIGNAAREAIENAVKIILNQMKTLPWQAKIARITEDKIYLNMGENAGIKAGESYFVYSIGEPITDPDTGAILGVEETKAAVIEITTVQEKLSIAKALTYLTENVTLKRGDLVREK